MRFLPILALIAMPLIAAANDETPLTVDPAVQLESDHATYEKDGLSLWVILADSPDSFLREWKSPSQPGAPRLRGRSAFHRGDIVLPAILYRTDGLTPEGKADIRYRFVFKRPDGSVYEEMNNKVVVDGVPPKGVGLFNELMGLRIEETDPFGPYTLLVEITDRVKNVTVSIPFIFTVTDPEAEKKALDQVAEIKSPEPAANPEPPKDETVVPVGNTAGRVRTSGTP